MFDQVRIYPDNVSINRAKRGHGWNEYKRPSPASFNRLLYVARKATLLQTGIYATYLVGQEITTKHNHYISLIFED